MHAPSVHCKGGCPHVWNENQKVNEKYTSRWRFGGDFQSTVSLAEYTITFQISSEKGTGTCASPPAFLCVGIFLHAGDKTP